MSITVEFNDFNEMVTFAKQIIGVPAAKQEAPAAKHEPENKKPAPSETGMMNTPEGVEEPIPWDPEPAKAETKTYTLEEVRAELAKLTRAGKQKEVKELLKSFGASKLTEIDPKDYLALMEKAGAL